MSMLVFQSFLLIAAAYLIGCVLGCLMRGWNLQSKAAKAGGGGLATAAAAALPLASPYQWSATRGTRELVMTGSVPSEAARADVVGTARRLFGGIEVVDQLKLASGAPAGMAGAAMYGLHQLSRLSTGEATLTDHNVLVTGIAPSHAAKAALLGNAAPMGYTLNGAMISVAKSATDAPASAAVAVGATALGVTSGAGSTDADAAKAQAELDAAAAAKAKADADAAKAEADAAAAAAAARAEADAAAKARAEADAAAVRAETEAKANAALSVSTPPVAAPLMLASPYVWSANQEGGRVVLSGFVPDEATRADIVGKATAAFPTRGVDDRMGLARGAPAGLAAAAGVGLGALAQLKAGEASITDSRLTVKGVAADASTQSAVRGLAAPQGYRYMASVDVDRAASMDAPIAPPITVVSGSAIAGAGALGMVASRVNGASAAPVSGAASMSDGEPEADAAAAEASTSGAATDARTAPPVGLMAAGAASAPVDAPAIPQAQAAQAAAADAAGTRPTGIAAPRNGKADNLRRVKGIGPQNEARLNALGTWHFDQIAGWTAQNAKWVGTFLAFPGRIEREDWINQAKALAAGEDTAFSKRYDTGGVTYQEVDKEAQARIVADIADDGFPGDKPKNLIDAPRGGKPDNLTLIDGIGNGIEKKLNAIGCWHFDQVAAWTDIEQTWIGHYVGFAGRPQREGWVREAAILASGGTTEHAKRVENGEISTSRISSDDEKG